VVSESHDMKTSRHCIVQIYYIALTVYDTADCFEVEGIIISHFKR